MNLFSTTCGVITSDFEFIPRLEEGFNWYPINTPKGNILIGMDKIRSGVCYSLNGLDNISNSERVIVDSYFWTKFADITSETHYYYYRRNIAGIFTLERIPILNTGLDLNNIQVIELFPVDGNFSSGIIITNNLLYLYIDNKVHIINLDSFTETDIQTTSRVPNFYFNNKFYSFDLETGFTEIVVRDSVDGFTWNSSPAFTIPNSTSISFWYSSNLPNNFTCVAGNYVYFLYDRIDTLSNYQKGLVRFDGTTWENIESNFISVLPDNYLDIRCINSNNNVLVLGTSFNKFLYSLDFGNTWNVVTVVPEWSNFMQISKLFPGIFWTNYRDTSEYL